MIVFDTQEALFLDANDTANFSRIKRRLFLGIFINDYVLVLCNDNDILPEDTEAKVVFFTEAIQPVFARQVSRFGGFTPLNLKSNSRHPNSSLVAIRGVDTKP